jgi:hypothetical protein
VFKEIDLKGVDVHNKDAMKAYLKTRAEILNK